jgi:hypothetical protein
MPFISTILISIFDGFIVFDVMIRVLFFIEISKLDEMFNSLLLMLFIEDFIF